VLALVLWSGCGGTPTQPSPLALGEPFELRLGERAEVARGLSLLFVDVASDSRCPIDAICVSGGDAFADVMFMTRPEEVPARALRVQLYVNGVPIIDGQLATVPWCVGDLGRWDCRLSTNAGKSAARAQEFTIRLVDLKPQRRAATPIARGDYVGTFVIAAQ
jgi:hypothetical protein